MSSSRCVRASALLDLTMMAAPAARSAGGASATFLRAASTKESPRSNRCRKLRPNLSVGPGKRPCYGQRRECPRTASGKFNPLRCADDARPAMITVSCHDWARHRFFSPASRMRPRRGEARRPALSGGQHLPGGHVAPRLVAGRVFDKSEAEFVADGNLDESPAPES